MRKCETIDTPTIISRYKILLLIITSLITTSVWAFADHPYEYRIPENAIKKGPFNTRERGVTYSLYYSPNVQPDSKSLIAQEFHTNGILTKRALYKNNKLHGVQREWYLNKKLKSEEPYILGKMNGIFQYWDSDGDLIGKYQLTNGTGTKLIFYKNGRLKQHIAYVDGEKNGLYLGFHENGQMSYWINCKDDEMIGPTFGFRDDSQIRSIIFFSKKGLLHGINSEYDLKDKAIVKLYMNGKETTKEKYKKSSSIDKSLPPLSHDPLEYKKYLSQEMINLIDSFKKLEPIKIPLEFNISNQILTLSNKPLILPK